MTKEQQQLNDVDVCLLALLRIGLQFETAEQCSVHYSAWDHLIEQARMQTVLPIIYHAIMQLPDDKKPPESTVSFLKAETVCSIISNERLLAVQDKLLALLKAEEIPCAILKGTSAAVYYPEPELRMQGDIDILVDKADMGRAVAALERADFQNSSTEHGFHKTFFKDGARIELHHALSAVPQNRAGDFITGLMLTAVPMACCADLENHVFPVLSDTHQAVSLLLHMQKHITSSGLGLRQLCDWAMFIRKVNPEQWQEKILAALANSGLKRFAQILTKTCVLYLGLPSEKCPWCLHVSNDICSALMFDFLKSGNFGKKDTVRGVSSFLISNSTLNARQNPALFSWIKRLNKNAVHHFPLTGKIPLLLPFMWVFLPMRYMVRMAFGKRAKHSLKKIFISASKREHLYRKFHLFETGDTLHSR